MTEQHQAEILAAWLAGDAPGTPEGTELDADAVEAVLALRPDLAPAPRVSADDILATVTTGPLATGSPAGLPPQASGADAPDVPEPANRPWMLALLGAGGASAALAAAAALMVTALVFTGTRSAPEMALEAPVAVSSAPQDVYDGAAALRDTGGMAEKKDMARKPAARRARPSPRPAPAPMAEPPRMPSPTIASARGAASGGGGPGEAADAVAFADEDDVVDDDFAFGSGEAKARQQMIPEMMSVDSPSGGRGFALDDAEELDDIELDLRNQAAPAADLEGAKEAVGRTMAPASAPPPPPVLSRPKRKAEEQRMAEGQAMAERERMETEEAVDAEPVAEPVASSLSRRARRGVGSVTDPSIQATLNALAGGDPTLARQTATTALGTTTDLARRQRLYALLGDAEMALGNPAAARAAYEEADAIRQRR